MSTFCLESCLLSQRYEYAARAKIGGVPVTYYPTIGSTNIMSIDPGKY